MDGYLQQQLQQNKPKLGQESLIQNLNYTQIPQPNNTQFFQSQISQPTMLYQTNSIQTLQNAVNIAQSEPQLESIDSQKENSSYNSINSPYISNSKSPSTSQEFQSSSFESQTENNLDNKDEAVGNPESVKKKQNQAQNAVLKEILGIAPNAGPDHQHIFVCRFSDSVNDEYVPHKQMRKRFSLQLIKFYESHLEEKIPRSQIQIPNDDSTT